jgi:nickel transport protein
MMGKGPASRASGRFRISSRAFGLPIFLLLSMLGGSALAHKLQVFASAEGALISGSAYFAGGGAASGARIEIRDGEGALLAEILPDREGKFDYAASSPVDHLIRAITADGHDAEWRVAGDELGAGFASAAAPVGGVGMPHRAETPPATVAGSAPLAGSNPVITAAPLQTSPDPALEAAIERAIARQIRPLREQLKAAEDRVLIQDILGGLGYILGLTGLALWWMARRPSDPQ